MARQWGSIRKNVNRASVELSMGEADQQHLDWLARSFGRVEYRPLSSDDLEAIRRVGEPFTMAPGGHLFTEGEHAVSTFVIDQGEVEIYRGEGARRRVVAHGGPGSVLGDTSMFDDRRHIASARVVRSVRGLHFTRARLLPELAGHPGILLRWLVASMRRMEESQQRVVRLMHKTVLAQIADLLLEESQRQPDVNLSQATMGMLLGVSRQSVNEALGRLRDQGVVDTGYRRVVVLDPDRLAEIAEV